ncbi:MAG TPA: hypothetical protein VFE42_03460 [Chloroflexota bacterium]|nr:hypothetical protein [Chloroflexota bacterium]
MTIQGRDDDVHPALTPHARPPTARLWTRLLWLAAAIAAAFLLVWTIAAHAAGALALLFVAIVLAEGLRPLVSWLHAHGLPRPFAVLLLYLFVLGGLGALLWALLSPLLGQLSMSDWWGRCWGCRPRWWCRC